MRYFSAFVLLFLLCLRLPVNAQSTVTDTLPGQTRLVQRLSALLCQRIQDSAKVRPLDQFTPEQADKLLRQLMLAGISEQGDSFAALMQQAQKRNMDNQSLGRAIGVATVLKLSADCPASMTLVMRTSSAQQAAGPNAQALGNVSAEERRVLQPLADSVCLRLTAEDARSPLKRLSAAAREERMGQLMQGVVLSNMTSLLQLYTEEQLADDTEMQRFGLKLASLMMTKCPSFLVMLGVDSINQKQAAKSATSAKKPVPAKAGAKPAPKARPGSRPAPKNKKK